MTETTPKLGCTRQTFSWLLDGRNGISPATVLALECSRWSNVAFWMRHFIDLCRVLGERTPNSEGSDEVWNRQQGLTRRPRRGLRRHFSVRGVGKPAAPDRLRHGAKGPHQPGETASARRTGSGSVSTRCRRPLRVSGHQCGSGTNWIEPGHDEAAPRTSEQAVAGVGRDPQRAVCTGGWPHPTRTGTPRRCTLQQYTFSHVTTISLKADCLHMLGGLCVARRRCVCLLLRPSLLPTIPKLCKDNSSAKYCASLTMYSVASN